jgi:capsular exopolysaccharide synthesis family protein
MSELFKDVNGGNGEITDLVRPLVETGTEPAQSMTAASNGEARSALPEGAAGANRPLAPGKAPFAAQIRTVALRVPAPSPLLPFGQGQWRPSEQYRILRTKLVQHPRQPRVIVISSPVAGDGKSVSAINTAAALSLKSEAQVLLVDADFRTSTVQAKLGLPELPGLAEVLRGACTVEEAFVRTQQFPNLFVMTGGAPPDNPVELLDSAGWQALNSKVRSLFRYVVLDSPPVGAVADYELIQAVCDGVILVVRPDHTNRQLCQKSLAMVSKAKLLGVLLNCVSNWSLARHAGSDYYYQSGEKAYSANHRRAGTKPAQPPGRFPPRIPRDISRRAAPVEDQAPVASAGEDAKEI